MRPDAMTSSFFARRMQLDRMDRAQGGQKSASAQGFGTSDVRPGEKGAGFKSVYNDVAKSNERAGRVTDSTIARQDSRQNKQQEPLAEAQTQETLQPTELALKAEDLSGDESLDPQKQSNESADILQILGLAPQTPQLSDLTALVLTDDSIEKLATVQTPLSTENNGARMAEASALISQALSEIAKALNLSIDPGLQNLSITGNAGDLAQQFSEILNTLKQIAGVLNDAAANNQSIVAGKNATIDPSQASELASFIQVRTFRIEIGVSMLGIADKVQAGLAQKFSGTVSGGIPQALDLASVSMPQAQIEKVFGDLFRDTSSSLSALVAKVRELCAGNNQAADAAAALKVVVSSTTVTQTVQTTGMPLNSLDSQVLRKLLKIDAQEQVAAQNAEAANQTVKINLNAGNLKPALNGAPIEVLKSADELLPVGDLSGKVSASQLIGGFEAKSAVPSFRGSDETVMNQITERLQTAVRSGLTEIRLQLRPESLGEVKLQIRVEGDVVFARIHVESQQVKQIVETNLQSLKESLMQQHLSCGSLDVSVGNEGWEKENALLHERMHGNTTASSGAADESIDGVPASADVTLGSETGRRFGDNTVEYFA
jgi:flagellar hook-length control protein FliK